MKSSMQGQAEGTYHEQTDKIMEFAGEPGDNQKLEAAGTDAKIAGKDQGKFDQFRKVLGKL